MDGFNANADALFTADTVSTACRPAVRATSPTSSLRVAAYAAPAAAATACTGREQARREHKHNKRTARALCYAPRPGPAAAGLRLRPTLPRRRGRRCRQPGAQPGCPSGPPARQPAPPAPQSPSAAPGPRQGRRTGAVREARPGRGAARQDSRVCAHAGRAKASQDATHRALERLRAGAILGRLRADGWTPAGRGVRPCGTEQASVRGRNREEATTASARQGPPRLRHPAHSPCPRRACHLVRRAAAARVGGKVLQLLGGLCVQLERGRVVAGHVRVHRLAGNLEGGLHGG